MLFEYDRHEGAIIKLPAFLPFLSLFPFSYPSLHIDFFCSFPPFFLCSFTFHITFFFPSSLPPRSVTRPTQAFQDLREYKKVSEYEGTFLQSARSLRRSVTSQKTGIRLMDLLLSRSTAASFMTIYKGE